MRLFFILLCLCNALYAANETTNTALTAIKDPNAIVINEINRLDTLIQATSQSLEGQKKLRERIVEYHKIQELYILSPKDNDILFRMVKSAYRTLELIKENHLLEMFDPDFIDELKVLSQAATKRGVPK